MYDIGVRVPCHRDILYGNFVCAEVNYSLFFMCICVTIYKLWKTRCKMSIEHYYVDSETVFKHIKAELKKRRTMDFKKRHLNLNWSAINM